MLIIAFVGKLRLTLEYLFVEVCKGGVIWNISRMISVLNKNLATDVLRRQKVHSYDTAACSEIIVKLMDNYI